MLFDYAKIQCHPLVTGEGDLLTGGDLYAVSFSELLFVLH